jgi:hypothetical protein
MTVTGYGQCDPTGVSKGNATCSYLCNGSISGRIYDCPATNGTPGSQCTPPLANNFWVLKLFNSSNVQIGSDVVQNKSSYVWGSPIPLSSTLCPGTYTVRFYSGLSTTQCFGSEQTTTIAAPPPILAIGLPNNPLCNGQSGSISISNVGGGWTPENGYNVSWTGPTPGNPVGKEFEGVIPYPTYTTSSLGMGDYSITITDDQGCILTLPTISLSQPPPLTPTITPINIPCSGGSGSIVISDLNSMDGTPGNGFNVSWSGPVSGPIGNPAPEIIPPNYTSYTIDSLTVTSPGNYYSVTITDANGCSFNQGNIQITQPIPLSVSTSTIPALCYNQASGSATFNVSGGNPGYNISWTGPTPGSPPGFEINTANGSYTANNLAAGTYTYTITDNGGGCSAIDTLTITQPPSALSILDTLNNILCFGANNGSVLVYGTGGTPQGNTPQSGYHVSWTGPSSGPVGNLATEIPTANPNIISGYYTIDSLVQQLYKPANHNHHPAPTNVSCGDAY